MLAGFKRQASRLEMPIVGRRDANRIDVVLEQLLRRVGPGKADELRAAVFAIFLRAAAGPARDGAEFDLNEAEVAAVQALGANAFEKGAVRVVEDHSHADHASTKLMGRQARWFGHGKKISRKGAKPQSRF